MLDLADCGSPLDGNYCARELARPALAHCGATPPKPEPLPVDLAMFRSDGMVAVSNPIMLQDARPDGDPRLRMSSSEALERFAAGIDAQSGGAMFAALALAAFQMRRRKGMRVVVA